MNLNRPSFYFAAFAITAATLTGCASGNYYLPGTPLISPEAIGPGGRGHLDLVGLQGGKQLLGTPQQGARDPNTAILPTPVLPTSFPNLFLGIWFPVDEETDLGIRLSANAPLLLSVRRQLNGNTRSTSQPGNFSISLVGSGGLLLGSGTQYWLVEAAAPVGYRLWQHHLFSLTPSFRLGGLQGDALPATGAMTPFSAALGYQYDVASLIFRFEGAWAAGTFARSNGDVSTGGTLFGLSLGFRIDPSP